ncbi:hypothetical protein BEN78_02230 [Xanthomonas citri pv. mangiferaeindicae]|nr:hypothetical protein BEN78_02230 [Xanthomonas citri pv. mangiferaeindicae]
MLEHARFVTTRPTSQWTASGRIRLALAALLSLALVLVITPGDLPLGSAGLGDTSALPDLPTTQDPPPEAKFRRPLPLSARIATRDTAPGAGLPQHPAMASTPQVALIDAMPASANRPPPDAADAPHALRPDLTLPPGHAPPRA